LSALAIALAESLEQAPVYAWAALAGRLLDVLERLGQAEVEPSLLPLLEGVDDS
jgi:hypothetical protein